MGNVPIPKANVKSLGMYLELTLSFEKQVSQTTKNTQFYLLQIKKVAPFLSQGQRSQVVQAMMQSRLDYCNSAYLGLSKYLTRHLQMVQNEAARVVLGWKREKRRDYIKPALKELHWLPTEWRIEFKVHSTIHKAINK